MGSEPILVLMKQVAALLFLTLALALPARAQDSFPDFSPPVDAPQKGDRKDAESTTAEERNAARLDLMFGRLANSDDERRANRIARHIMRRMMQSGSDTIDFLMARSAEAIQENDYPKALDLLDGVVRLKPEFAEGWNRRATVHFLNGDYGQSVADIEQVLRLEPRHFEALAGLGVILEELGDKKGALEAYRKAVEIDPWLRNGRERIAPLELEVEGRGI